MLCKNCQVCSLEDFLNSLRGMENAPVEFDESMWRLPVEKVVVKKDGFLKFVRNTGYTAKQQTPAG